MQDVIKLFGKCRFCVPQAGAPYGAIPKALCGECTIAVLCLNVEILIASSSDADTYVKDDTSR